MISKKIHKFLYVIYLGVRPAFVVFFINQIAYRFFGVYKKWPSFDIPAHILGGVAIAFGVYQALNYLVSKRNFEYKKFLYGALMIGATALFAIFWEWYEFFNDSYLNSFHQQSIKDTMVDMFFGLFGACALYLVVLFGMWKKAKA